MTAGTPDPYGPERQNSRRAGGAPPGRRRSPARVVTALAVAAWAVGELWLLTVVADLGGALAVLALLLAGVLLGAVVIRRAGRRAWQRLVAGLQPPEAASEQAAVVGDRTGGNALAMLGGVLLMVPGPLSDVVGLLCLFPPTAGLIRRSGRRYLNRRGGFGPGTLGDAMRQARTAQEQYRIHRPDGRVVEGEVVRDDEPPSR